MAKQKRSQQKFVNLRSFSKEFILDKSKIILNELKQNLHSRAFEVATVSVVSEDFDSNNNNI